MVVKERVAYVEWVDSCTNRGWREKQEALTSTIRSVGLVVGENSDFITLSTSRSDNGDHVDQISIPKKVIKKIRKFTVRR
jgi:hypothetical protein